jgi:polar amino acid transport system substrate-binding protein
MLELRLFRSTQSRKGIAMRSTVLTGAILLSSASLPAQPASPTVISDLAPSGTLRASINYGNALLARRDTATGELSGVSVDMARELAHRLGIPVQLVPFDAAGKVTDAVKTGAWDVAFLAIDPARATDIDFTAPYVKLEGTYMVPAGSPLQTIEDVDREGVRIAVARGSAYDLYLTRSLKHAQLIRAENTNAAIDLFRQQKLEAIAGIRTALVIGNKLIPDATILRGAFMTIPQAMGVPKGHPAAAQYLRGFVEEMKASGFIAQALKRHGLENEADVVPPSISTEPK